MKNNLTTSFLMYLMPDEIRHLHNCEIFYGWEGEPEKVGKCLYLFLKNKPFNEYNINTLKKSKEISYCAETSEKVVFRKELTRKEYQSVVIPFMLGKYSEICREYVSTHFSPVLKNTSVIATSEQIESVNWLVLTKSSKLRERWESFLDVSIPDTAELYSIPNPRNEILDYEKMGSKYKELGTEDLRSNRAAIIDCFGIEYS